MVSDIEYCNNCGLLHDPDDGKCLGCELTQEKKALQSKLSIAMEALTKCRDEAHNYMEDLEGYQIEEIVSNTEKQIEELGV